MSRATLLVIDNYDSFTHNLVQMFMHYDLNIIIYRADKIGIADAKQLAPDYILISPGPKDPSDSGISVDLVKHFAGKLPILGVCLGMQCINTAFGGKTVAAPVPVHGKTSRISHDNTGLFSGMPSPFTAARYHSLAVRLSDGAPLKVTARADDGVIMGLESGALKLYGVQFHPESFLTECGFKLIHNFLKTNSPGMDLSAPALIHADNLLFTEKTMSKKNNICSMDAYSNVSNYRKYHRNTVANSC